MHWTAFWLLLMLLGLQHIRADINFEMFKDEMYPLACVVQSAKGKLIIKPGKEARYPGKCGLIACGENGWGLVYTCPIITPQPGCVLGDYKYPKEKYPECCKRFTKCAKENVVAIRWY